MTTAIIDPATLAAQPAAQPAHHPATPPTVTPILQTLHIPVLPWAIRSKIDNAMREALRSKK